MSDATRRGFIQASAAISLLGAADAAQPLLAAEGKDMNSTAFGHQHAPVPLAFDPKSLKGISEKLIQSHWENNYSGASKALNLVRGRLSQAAADTNTPPYIYNGLKREQLIRTGSVVLHELYFANLGGSGKPGSAARSTVSA